MHNVLITQDAAKLEMLASLAEALEIAERKAAECAERLKKLTELEAEMTADIQRLESSKVRIEAAPDRLSHLLSRGAELSPELLDKARQGREHNGTIDDQVTAIRADLNLVESNIPAALRSAEAAETGVKTAMRALANGIAAVMYTEIVDELKALFMRRVVPLYALAKLCTDRGAVDSLWGGITQLGFSAEYVADPTDRRHTDGGQRRWERLAELCYPSQTEGRWDGVPLTQAEMALLGMIGNIRQRAG